MRSRKSKLAAACAFAALVMSAAAQASDSHTLTVSATVAGNCKFIAGASSVNLTVDPTLATTVSQPASIEYRCTKGTSPTFSFASASTSSGAGGNLTLGLESIPYTFTATPGGAGLGMGPGNERTLTVDVSVNQANAADVTPGTYTDTIAITLNP